MNETNKFQLTNSSGAYVELTNVGASIVSIVVPDKNGTLENIVLNYDNENDYLHDTFYLGSTIGRYANRISNASFTLNGNTYNLDKNDGRNTNHGGYNGLNKHIFDYRQADRSSIIFFTLSVDGEGGFPGNISIEAEYSFNDNCELQIVYRAVADQPTPFNPTNHAYFNLAFQNGNILEHELRIYADEYLESDNEFLPTGRILPLKNTAFDFRKYHKIKEMVPLKNDIIKGLIRILSVTINKINLKNWQR